MPLTDDGGTGTIEFRQAPGTTSARIAVSWVEFYVRFVEYTIQTSDGVLTNGGRSLDDLDTVVPPPACYER